LKRATEFIKGMPLEAEQELEVVMDVVYMNGYPLPQQYQLAFLTFIKNNPNLFTDDTRNW